MWLVHDHPYLALAQAAFMVWMLVDAYSRRAEGFWLWVIVLVPVGITGRDPRWSNYAAWRLLASTRVEAGDRAGGLAACRELAHLAPTLEHRCLLAEHLLDHGLHDEAREVLERSLLDYDYAPGPIRRINRRWASHARRLQKRVAAR